MRTTTVIPAAAVLLLTGCATISGSGGSGTLPEAPETHCIVGTWQLDLADFAAQSEEYLNATGVPISGVTMSGHQTLTITENPEELYFGMSSELRTDGVVSGVAVSAEDGWAGGAPFVFADGSDDELVLGDWEYSVEPGDPAGESAPLAPYFDPATTGSAPVEVVCSGDTLEVHGPDAPLTGRFVRVGP